MSSKWIIRILIGLTIMTLLSGIITYAVIKTAVIGMFGGKTEIVETRAPDRSSEPIYITDVNVLSPTSESFMTAQTVAVENGKITRVGGPIEPPTNAIIIDGRGQYLVPGFTDSHIHLWRSENDLLLYIANGVTQVHEMHGAKRHLKWRSEIETGRLGPDIFVVAAQLATYGFLDGIWNRMTSERNVVRSENGVSRRVKSLKTKGYDAVKASSFLSLPAYEWASTAAEDIGMPFVGHIPLEANLDDFWASNQTELAHIEELVKALNRDFGGYTFETTDEFLAFVQRKAGAVAQRLYDKEIPVTSTIHLIQSFGSQQTNLNATLDTVQLDYVNPGLAESDAMGWLPAVNRYRVADQYRTEGWEDRQTAYWTAYADAQEILLDACLEMGVTILAGTDANVPVMVPGFSLHDEMKAMQDAGMTPTEVLASATTAPAAWMGSNTGQITEGYDADLVLLRDNPLEDIRATTTIERVFVNGYNLDRRDLDLLLESVLQANNASRTVSLN
jgi:hypothetical protein